ncbi:iron ABC transporter permease [Leeia sp. TBRC 13508]|uniref:Iron ABC transporter permease n=1 Tax=Leeia speluncae TaxID=2884804 RepID=A0ABS8D4X0_9NEIS|nr:iron ABC transporter permease [Leeia speluncae]MCB6183162.1 iron ABC transporter permease [Leeia speluncae]
MNILARYGLPRMTVVLIMLTAILMPIGLVVWQSGLDAPFFMPNHAYGLDAYRFIFDDPDFWSALKNTIIIAVTMLAIAVPLGGALAFLLARTDLPCRRAIELMVMVPVFVSPFVLGFGYVVATGPVGFYSLWFQQLFGVIPWNIYSVGSIAVIAGLTHVPHVYLYASSALKNLGSDVEEAARVSGASPFEVARRISLPMVSPSLLYAGVLVFFLGFEIFGLPLILGDPEGHLVLASYLYKLTNKLGIPSYHLMAAVAVCLICVTFPLVLLQRYLLRSANRYIAVKGKVTRQKRLPLGNWRWAAFALVTMWLFVTVVVPLSGITFRAFVSFWGEGVTFSEAFTLHAFAEIWNQPNLLRSVLNSVLIGVIGGAVAVMAYTAIGLASHRKQDGLTRIVDYLVLIPRAVPGLLAGLAFLWVFLFVPGLKELRSTLISVWLAYTVVWLAYGMRLISSALLQVAPELEESARTLGASAGRTSRDVTIPLIKFGLLSSWVLMFMIFEREYSTGVYLLSPGTEVIGSMLVSLWAAGAVDIVAALSLINVALVAIGLAIALKFGVNLHE